MNSTSAGVATAGGLGPVIRWRREASAIVRPIVAMRKDGPARVAQDTQQLATHKLLGILSDTVRHRIPSRTPVRRLLNVTPASKYGHS